METKKTKTKKQKNIEYVEEEKNLDDFSLETKDEIINIINDSPSLVKVGEKEYVVKNMRFYSLYRICGLVVKMKKENESLNNDNAILTALCTDLDAMCEIVAIVLCNHLFTRDGEKTHGLDDLMSKNDMLINEMKARIMESTFEEKQWAAIILGAIKSIDLTGFFLLKKSVSTLTDSLLNRKKMAEETASQFMEAQSLQTQATL